MLEQLNENEARILGSLVEKQLTTPEYYPLTLNALVNACNQKNNREPVVSYTESIVTNSLEQGCTEFRCIDVSRLPQSERCPIANVAILVARQQDQS